MLLKYKRLLSYIIKLISCLSFAIGIHHFLKNNLDALFIMTNAPGRSAFNRAERRMAPLSKELAGLLLPHDHHGNHLDSQGKFIKKKLLKYVALSIFLLVV